MFFANGKIKIASKIIILLYDNFINDFLPFYCNTCNKFVVDFLFFMYYPL